MAEISDIMMSVIRKDVIMNQKENLYQTIAENIRKGRKRLCISQAGLAELAEISVDTVKSVEQGRRTMSLDTYLRLVQALETTPFTLMNKEKPEEYMERFLVLVNGRKKNEIEFALYTVEQLLKGQDRYLKG